MKSKPLSVIAALLLLLPLAAFSQSSFFFRNAYPGVNAPVFDAQGVPLAGANYLAELWGAATPDSLTPLVIFESPESREIVPFTTGGYFSSDKGSLCVLEVPAFGFAWLQVRAWDARLGATYEEVTALGLGGYGESPLLYAQGGNPLVLPPSLPGPLIGLQSFSLRAVVPEPSTWVLLALGGVALGWAARRRPPPQ